MQYEHDVLICASIQVTVVTVVTSSSSSRLERAAPVLRLLWCSAVALGGTTETSWFPSKQRFGSHDPGGGAAVAHGPAEHSRTAAGPQSAGRGSPLSSYGAVGVKLEASSHFPASCSPPLLPNLQPPDQLFPRL
ncbi:hypothetical protein EYF80_055067 [Liparis tanakae]|uniref:Uncharacterized protein n=1 Tax=Liparis tanakae TaxID=230148 RepID=A0A4Z2F0N8_9TELE|nr:hypothetical protein EYF80_055067 [Liparis tanakae]